MRLIHLILLVLVAIVLMLGWLLVLPEPELSTGATHPQFAGMNVGGDGFARLGEGTWIFFTVGALSLLLMVLLVALGVQERRRTGLFWVLLTAAGCVSQYAWWCLYSSYLRFLETGAAEFVLGFPLATSWMLFGIWCSGALLCLVYVFGFRRFIFSEADEAAYEALRAAAAVPRAPEAGGDSR